MSPLRPVAAVISKYQGKHILHVIGNKAVFQTSVSVFQKGLCTQSTRDTSHLVTSFVGVSRNGSAMNN